MTESALKPLTTKEILQLHEDLEIKYGDGDGGNFLFGWQSINPYAQDLIDAVKRRSTEIDYTKYSCMEDDSVLADKVIDLHRNHDGIAPDGVLCAASGGTSILFAFSYWLARREIKEVHYIPPIYFTLLNGLRQFGIHARAVSGYHPFEREFRLALPQKKTVLIFADPIWYAGSTVPEHILAAIAAWQSATGSLVFIDGSFQYMRWDGKIYEPTARFDLMNTIRLVSPTKSLVVHGYRFAYALLPQAIKPILSNCYSNIAGPAAADCVAFAYEAIRTMRERRLTNELMKRASTRHAALRNSRKIESELVPQTGYFVFEKINATLPDCTFRMDGRYFGQTRFPQHVRMNLLSTQYHLLEM